MNDHSQHYLDNVRTLFRYYKSLGDKTLAQLSEEEIRYQPHPQSNNIATIVKHMAGNMRARWTDLFTSDGEKTWRNREGEFEDTLNTKSAVIEVWEAGWACLFAALDPLSAADMDRLVYIRNEGHSLTEAINRQLGHYSYHVGQIVLIGKMCRGEAWQSLSIPKGQSKAFNAEKFGKHKTRKNFI